MNAVVLPEYGQSTLSDLLPSVGAHLGMSVVDRLGLPSADRYLVLLIDGLGTEQLAQHAELAPYLSGLLGRSITAGVPSTTATSITSLGTGLAPGAHGVAGYTFWYPPLGEVLNSLRWASGLDALDVQPQLTYFERFAKAGIHTGVVAPATFARSGLTGMSLRGATFWPISDEQDVDQRVDAAVAAVSGGARNLSYCYERILDHVGHEQGVASEGWRNALVWADRLAQSLRRALPADVRLIVTGDHGMVDVPDTARLLIEDVPELLTDVTAICGEGRLRQLQVAPGRIKQVIQHWRNVLGERAWVRSRDEAAAEGWFGHVAARMSARFGDVVVAMVDDGAVLTLQAPGELNLIGMHGSLTSAEMRVPLLID
jgi:hypothetical protein